MLKNVHVPILHLKDYENLIPDTLKDIKLLSPKLKGLKIIHINATAVGGGVAEMLRSQIALERDAGLKSEWYVIPPDGKFFAITKSIHNFMQGKDGDLSEEDKDYYLKRNLYIASLLDEIKKDILIIHDPQPLAAISYLKDRPGLTIWRCHIDTTSPNKKIWQFLNPYIGAYDVRIFTAEAYVNKSLKNKENSFITPGIDPFSEKNKNLDGDTAMKIITGYGINPTFPFITQVSRLDPWKDPKGVINAYRLVKKEFNNLQLVFVAQSASDDPEGVLIEKEVREYAGGDKNIFFLVNLKDNDTAVNAFQRASSIVMQKSVREGFAITVTEAMWKNAVVIGGNVGGIKLQIEDGKNGFLVNSAEEAAEKTSHILENPEQGESIRLSAKESVKEKYLMPNIILKYFQLFGSKLLN